jgi:isoleucyl-tRNA synthetase
MNECHIVAIKDKVPFRSIVTHGFVMDQEGRKMSKSLGNIIDPYVVINGGKVSSKLQSGKRRSPYLKNSQPYGADILRLWVASTDFTKDVNIGKVTIGRYRPLLVNPGFLIEQSKHC